MQSQRWVDLEPGVVWPGDVDEFVRLLCSVGAHCTCRSSEYVSRGWRSCPAHQLLWQQHVLDHLVFARRMRERLIRAEWSIQEPPSEAAARKRTWRPNLFMCAVAALLIMFVLSGTLPATHV